MKRFSYGKQDYAFGKTILSLRSFANWLPIVGEAGAWRSSALLA